MKLPKLSSLYWRIFAIFWITIFTVLIAVIGLQKLDPRRSHSINTEALTKINQLVSYIEKDLNSHPEFNALPNQLNKYAHNYRNQGFRLYMADSDGNVLNKEMGPRRHAVQSMAALYSNSSTPSQKLFDRFMVAGPFPIKVHDQNLAIYAGFNTKLPSPLFYRILDTPFQLLFLVMLVSTPLLMGCSWKLSQPARRLEDAAKRVTQGEFEVDPSLEQGSCEFKQTGASFNQMVLSINRMVSGQQKLLSDISHELRSPLTRLRMANALATRKQGASKELARIETEAERLEQMIKDLLDLSRMQIDSHHNRTQLELPVLWNNILLDAKFEAEQNKMSLTYDLIPNESLVGNDKLLTSAFENIVRNAIRYGDSKVNVTFTKRNNELTLCVEDDGPGVPEDELESIFRPFYRVSTARDRESGGTGLGLAITENAILQHNGTIVAQKSELLGGLKMKVTLPLQA
jgi:two-component system sensor histidine kinase CpxA